MNRVFKMALKDLKILSRDKLGAFFIIGFPILMGVFFGLMTGGFSEGGRGKMKIAVVDQDQSVMSAKFIEGLRANESLEVETDEYDAASESVRLNKRLARIVLPKGFGEKAGVFWGEPAEIQILVDPARSAETGMLQGLIMESVGKLAGERFNDPKQLQSSINASREAVANDKEIDPISRGLLGAFFGSIDNMIGTMDELQQADQEDADPTGGGGFQFAKITKDTFTKKEDPKSKNGQLGKLKSRWDISFPQGMMWGILGCVAGFSISIARENTLGTMTRLKAAPISRFQILASKALACFMATIAVIALLTAIGMWLGMRPGNYLHLVIASVCVAFCFVGIMMTFSVLGKSEQSVSGAGWAINMVMAMFGGCMIPVMFMPGFMQKLSVLSPIRWGILALEGAIWREFSLVELVYPCFVLLTVGAIGMVIGTYVLSRRD